MIFAANLDMMNQQLDLIKYLPRRFDKGLGESVAKPATWPVFLFLSCI
jgi:hypothetical protein